MNNNINPALADAAGHLDVASTILDQLGDLFAGIKKLAENNLSGDPSIAGMAGLGQHVAQDWANTVGVQKEEILIGVGVAKETQS